MSETLTTGESPRRDAVAYCFRFRQVASRTSFSDAASTACGVSASGQPLRRFRRMLRQRRWSHKRKPGGDHVLALIAAFALIPGITEVVVAVGGKRLIESSVNRGFAPKPQPSST
jgi:hypothetical protein